MASVSSRRSRRRRQGQALVEFALVIPIFLLLLMAVFDLGRAVFAYNSVTNAAREGARLAIVNQSAVLIQQRAMAQSAIAETAAPNVTVEFRKTEPNADYLTNPICNAYNGATPKMALDCVAIVTFQTTFRPITPLISNILFASGVTLTARSVQTVEYVCPSVSVPVATNCAKQP
jgi:Flp pilus assembly protein TadG